MIATLFALAMFSTNPQHPDAPEYRTARFSCGDALQTVHVTETPDGPRLVFGFQAGYESCEDSVKRVLPLVYQNKNCFGIEFLGGDRAVYCMPGRPV